MEPSDDAAVAQARAGNTDAFRVLVERHSQSVFRLAFRMTGNEQDAEDLVQETFLRAYRQLGKFDGRASFGTWLYRIAANCSLDLIRSRKRRQEQQTPVDDEGQEIAAAAGVGRAHAGSPGIQRRVEGTARAGAEPFEPDGADGFRAAALRRHVY